MGARVEGISELVAKLRELDGASEAAILKGLLAGGMVLESGIKTDMQQTPRGGKTYARGGRSHTSSTPGSAPAVDYGFLINSIATAEENGDVIVFSTAEAAPALEFGTARVAARPFMRPAAKNYEREIAQAVEAVVRGEIR